MLDRPAEPTAVSQAKDTPKSRRTRARILDETVRLLAEGGYERAGNAAVAEAAGLTRGAMLYHFPTREALIEAAAGHAQARRVALLREAAEEGARRGLDPVDAAIDAYAELVFSPPFRAFAELEAAARRDPALAPLIRPAQEAFDRATLGDGLSGFVSAGAEPRLQAARDLARFALEGLAHATLTYAERGRVEALVRVLKRAVHMLNRKGGVHDLWG